MGETDALYKALAEVVDANDELHNALGADAGDKEDHRKFVAAQRRETLAIEAARALVLERMALDNRREIKR